MRRKVTVVGAGNVGAPIRVSSRPKTFPGGPVSAYRLVDEIGVVAVHAHEFPVGVVAVLVHPGPHFNLTLG